MKPVIGMGFISRVMPCNLAFVRKMGWKVMTPWRRVIEFNQRSVVRTWSYKLDQAA
jgi:hypothetical protein